jgi:hypothetical protein
VRQLVDDGEALPPLPRVAASVERVSNLCLQLVSGPEDANYAVWNRLIIRQHPLKAAPLVGTQLRYLIVCDEGIIGAFGFGPPAFHLECRDSWIGWDQQSRQANRAQVIGLSRFLIRPGIRCANLASRCYRLVLSRVGRDWQERYGIKPVLVETYVDRSTQTGTSLSAANWRRLGQSGGRGRSSPSPRVRPKSVKDVWVYELTPKAREILQRTPEPAVTPRSIFHGLGADAWTEEELDGLDLGSVRLERRFAFMLRSRWEQPGRSFCTSFGSNAAGKAAYRLIESPQAGVSFQTLLAPHRHQTHRRMAAESVVVLAQDTTTLSYNSLTQTQGLGPTGDRASSGQGLLLHTLQAFRTDRIPLGCAWAQVWARPAESDTAHRNEQSVADKESRRWIDAYQAASALARSMPRSQLVVCGDRESDIFELFDQTEVAPENLYLLVRAQHDRLLAPGQKLWETLRQQPCGGTQQISVPRRSNRPARTATLALRWCPIQISPPQVALKKSWQPIPLYAVMARELNPPPGVEPIEWVLVTDWKVDSFKLAWRMVKWYGLRWGIECWHQVLKDVCKVETRQMKSAQALERALVLDMIVASRAHLLCRLGKEHPNLPASLYYSEQELAVLDVYKKKIPQWLKPDEFSPAPVKEPPAKPPQDSHQLAQQKKSTTPGTAPAYAGSSLSVIQANVLVAMLAGFWGRKSDGHPGPKSLAQGLTVLAGLVEYRALTEPLPPRQPPPLKRSRKPG